MVHRGVPSAPTASVPTRKRATSSIGFWVADRPMRVRVPGATRLASRSSDSARCEPRLELASAWISSTITLRAVASMRRPDSLVSSRYSDSGVVTRMCGGRLLMAARSPGGVSPVRTSTRKSISLRPWRVSSVPMPASGHCRLRSMSFDSALSGDTYTTRVSSASQPASASCTSSSIAARNAASVLPEPVGAAISVCRPARIAGQAAACGAVGAGNARANQAATAGWKVSSGMTDFRQPQVGPRNGYLDP